MLTSGCVLVELKKDEQPSYYFSLNNSDLIYNTDTRPSLDQKYDQKFTSKFAPFYEKALTLTEFARIKGITNSQALDSILIRSDISEYDSGSLNEHYEPELAFSTCYGAKDNISRYGWNYNEYQETASVWILRHSAIYTDCSESEKNLNISTFVNLNIASSDRYESFLKDIISKSIFIENNEGVNGPIQSFKYTNNQDGRKYRIECCKNLNELGGEIKIYWDNNATSRYSISNGY